MRPSESPAGHWRVLSASEGRGSWVVGRGDVGTQPQDSWVFESLGVCMVVVVVMVVVVFLFLTYNNLFPRY